MITVPSTAGKRNVI